MNSKSINLAFICDDAYALGTGVTIFSLSRCRRKDKAYQIYVLCNDVSPHHIKLFYAMSHENFTIQIIDVSQDATYATYPKMRHALHVSATALFKFNLPKLLPFVDKVLYMDSDILIRDSLEALYNMDIKGWYAGVCKDIGAEHYPSQYNKRLHIQHSAYFNSGVMLFNLKLMREHSISQKLLDYKKNGINHFMDQDAFNVVFAEKVKFFSPMYNMMISCWRKNPANILCDYYDIPQCSIEEFYNQAKVLHLSAPEKPWLYNNAVAAEEWLVNFILSPWRKVELHRTQHPKGLDVMKNGCDYSKIISQVYPVEGCAAPLVSVIIPVYNAAKYLNSCIESLMMQTLSEAEYIFVDDGSTDTSVKILNHYAKLDMRIQVYQQKNSYAGVARNNGISHATGKYITFLDSDDAMLPTALELFYQQAVKKNADIIVSSAFFFEQDMLKRQVAHWCLRKEFLPVSSTFSIQNHAHYLFQVSAGAPWGKFYKSEFVRKHQFYFPPLQRAEDFFFVYWAFAVAETIASLKTETVLYRIYAGSGSLEDAKDRFPLAALEGRKLLWQKLNEIGVYDKVEQSFINATVNSVVHNLKKFYTGAAFEQMYRSLKEEIIPLFRIDIDNASYFYSKGEYQYFKEICDSPSCADYLFTKYKEASLALKRLKHTSSLLAAEIRAIRSSWTYRIGRFIIFIPQKIRGVIRHTQEHGPHYTLLLVKEKLLGCIGSKAL
ncbi:MAG: glycosyltransferase [Christensenellales bacterium]|jgi:lipopolysaccharide biosynthesis glycosyltransferase